MRKIGHYTLVELLVVVAVAALILGIATPAFTTLIKGNAMTASTRELSAKIKAARSYAITNNCYVALVFPTGPELSGDVKKTNFYYSIYRPCVVTQSETANQWNFDTWIDGENWKTFHRGVLINKNVNDFGYTTTPSSGSSYPNPQQLLSTVDSVPVGTLITGSTPDMNKTITSTRAIIFKPNGQLALNTNEILVLRLAEGVPTDTNPILTKITSANKTVYQRLEINPLSCRITFLDEEAGI